MTKKNLLLATLTALLMSAQCAPTLADESESEELEARRFSFALIGDQQYNADEETRTFPPLKKDIDAEKLAFVVHDGDFKGGRVLCSDALFEDRHATFDNFAHPFVFLFGDNEWTDCHRAKDLNHAEYSDPFNRLAKLRKLFAENHGDRSLGQRTLRLERHSTEFPEIVRWRAGKVMFVGLHVVGSNNGLTTGAGLQNQAIAEYQARNQANLDWLRESFRLAKAENSPGIMIVMQANPWDVIPKKGLFGFYGAAQGNPYAQEGILPVLEAETKAFGKPVVLVHGDSHYYRIDQPLPAPEFHYDASNPADGDELGPMTWENGAPRIANFTRVETFGTPNAHWLKVTVDPRDRNVFRFEPRIVKDNIAP